MQFKSLEQAIRAVRDQRARDKFPMQPPCLESDIANLCDATKAAFGATLPDRYLDMLRITNGFWENGLHVYADKISDLLPPSNAALNGFVEATRMYRENFCDDFAEMLVFAENDAYIFAYHVPSRKYVKQAYVESTQSRSFDIFDDLLICAVEPILIEPSDANAPAPSS